MKNDPRQKKSRRTRSPSKDSLPPAFSTDLGDRQSVRTTFRLTKTGSEALKSLAKRYGVTFKDVFDNLCGTILADKHSQDLRKDSTPARNSLLYDVARIASEPDAKTTDDTVRKTHLISRGALKALKELSREYQIPRNVLVDRALILIELLAEEASRKKHKSRKKALRIVSDFVSEAYITEDKLKDVLEPDDPIVARFEYVVIVLDNLRFAIESNLEKDAPIDPDDPSQSC